MRIRIRAKHFGARHVLGRLSFDVAPGAVVAITGPSGCGKTTLLRLIAGLDDDFDGQLVAPARIGMVFQEPRLLPWRTVLDNIRVVLPQTAGEAGCATRARTALASVALEKEAGTYPRALSLGMARRVAIARALVIEPQLLILDEPFVSLDEATAGDMRNLIAQVAAAPDRATLIVTHDLRDAVALADRVIMLAGPPATVIADVPLGARGARSPDWIAKTLARLRACNAAEG